MDDGSVCGGRGSEGVAVIAVRVLFRNTDPLSSPLIAIYTDPLSYVCGSEVTAHAAQEYFCVLFDGVPPRARWPRRLEST